MNVMTELCETNIVPHMSSGADNDEKTVSVFLAHLIGNKANFTKTTQQHLFARSLLYEKCDTLFVLNTRATFNRGGEQLSNLISRRIMQLRAKLGALHHERDKCDFWLCILAFIQVVDGVVGYDAKHHEMMVCAFEQCGVAADLHTFICILVFSACVFDIISPNLLRFFMLAIK
jgi:hypothetical protein